MTWHPNRADEPCLGDLIYLISDVTGKPDGRLTKVLRVVAEDHDEELWEVVDKLGQTRIVTAGAKERSWLEVVLD